MKWVCTVQGVLVQIKDKTSDVIYPIETRILLTRPPGILLTRPPREQLLSLLNKMASNLEKIDTALFLDMYHRIGTNVQYFVLTKVHDNANLFTKNVFHFHSEDYAFEFKRLLKKPKVQVRKK